MPKIKVGDFRIGKEEKEAVNQVLDSGQISEGKKVREFERKWAEYIGTKYCVATNSGTSALIAGLTALKYYGPAKTRSRNKIITTPITYISTSNAIVLSGFEPVYVDIEDKTFHITPENILAKLREGDPSKYLAILPVHLMGYSCDMDAINEIARKYDLIVFEDSAQAHGTVYKGKRTGSLSLLSDFSFYIAHNIQAGEFGAITTDSSEISALIRKIKTNGRMCDCPVCTRMSKKGCPKMSGSKSEEDFDPRFTHDIIGYNFKAMEFQAALALVQLKKIDWIIKRRLENVKYLNEKLKKFSGLLQLPVYDKNVSYILYPVVIKKPNVIARRKLRAELEALGIETRALYGSIPGHQPAYGYLKKEYTGKLPTAEYIGLNTFYVGCHQYLTKAELDYIVECFNKILKEYI